MNLKEGLALQAAAKKKGKDKYGAKRTVLDGITFASGGEAKRYAEIALHQKLGLIRNLTCQIKLPIIFNGIHICNYTADFSYEELTPDYEDKTKASWKPVVEDFKSKGTKRQRDWPRTKKLVRACHGITIRESGID